eukprot:gene1899-4993_t
MSLPVPVEWVCTSFSRSTDCVHKNAPFTQFRRHVALKTLERTHETLSPRH